MLESMILQKEKGRLVVIKVGDQSSISDFTHKINACPSSDKKNKNKKLFKNKNKNSKVRLKRPLSHHLLAIFYVSLYVFM